MQFSIGVAVLIAAQQASSGVVWKPLQGAPEQPASSLAKPAPKAILAPIAPQAVILSGPTENVLRAGAEILLITSESMNSNDKTLRPGKLIRMQVANPISLGGAVVIPAGTPVTGEVTEV